METLLIAKIFAIVFFVMGLTVSLRPEELKQSVEALFKNKGINLLAGLFTLFVGAFLIAFHDKWDTPAEIAVSLLGYLVVLKGFLHIAFPESIKKMSESVFKEVQALRIVGIIMILASLTLFYATL